MDGMGLFFKGTPRLLPASGGDASFWMQPLKGVERGIAFRRRTEIVGLFMSGCSHPSFALGARRRNFGDANSRSRAKP